MSRQNFLMHWDTRWEGLVMDELNRRAFELDSRGGGGAMLFIAGAVIGAAAALILAPATGRDTRAFIGRRGKEFADDMANRGKEMWREHGDRITSAVRRGYESAKGTAADGMNGATDTGHSM
jgi:gas vesicle protein